MIIDRQTGSTAKRSPCRANTQREPEAMQVARKFEHRALVQIVHAQENLALERQPISSRQLRFGKRVPELRRMPHDFAGAAHLGSEERIHAKELLEWQDRLL